MIYDIIVRVKTISWKISFEGVDSPYEVEVLFLHIFRERNFSSPLHRY